MTTDRKTHGVLVGYGLWLFGFLGAHRFYYGRRISGTIYLCTLGLLGVGWVLDLFLMPLLARDAAERYHEGPYRYDVAWLLLTYGGIFGLHRFYLGKVWSGLLYLCTGGLVGAGIVYDVAWLLLTYGGVFGLHRFYLGKVGSGLLYLCTGGLVGAGIVYDFWTLNEQVSIANGEWKSG